MFAVKILKDSANLSHLKNEVSILQKVGSHPNIVNLHDREYDETPFMVVDLCQATLGDVLADYGLPFPDPRERQKKAKEKIVELAKAVQFVHDTVKEVVIDLDPLNIMFEYYNQKNTNDPADYLNGTIKICDLNSRSGETSFHESLIASLSTSISIGEKGSQHFFAKPYFIAPELLIPGTEPTFAADVYTLGRLLQVMLTGKKELKPQYLPSKIGIAPSYDEIIIKALENNVNDRFATIDSFLEALEYADQNPIEVTVGWWDRFKHGGRENALAFKKERAMRKWNETVENIAYQARRKIGNEMQEIESKKRRIESEKRDAIEVEKRNTEKKLLEEMLTSRPDESKVAFKKSESENSIVIYQVNQINNDLYRSTEINLPAEKETRNFQIKWLAWVDDSKKLAYYATYDKMVGTEGSRNWKGRSLIGLIDLGSLEINNQELEYNLKEDDINANVKSSLIYAVNEKNDLIQFDLLNQNIPDRVMFVPVRGLKVCDQTTSCCGRFIVNYNKPDIKIVDRKNNQIYFTIGTSNGGRFAWYDPAPGELNNKKAP